MPTFNAPRPAGIAESFASASLGRALSTAILADSSTAAARLFWCAGSTTDNAVTPS